MVVLEEDHRDLSPAAVQQEVELPAPAAVQLTADQAGHPMVSAAVLFPCPAPEEPAVPVPLMLVVQLAVAGLPVPTAAAVPAVALLLRLATEQPVAVHFSRHQDQYGTADLG